MAIITLDRVKAILQIPAGITFHDTAIGYATDFANGRVLGALGQRTLAVTTVQEYHTVEDAGMDSILLKHSPIVSLVAVTNDGALLVQGTHFRLDEEDIGVLRLMRAAGYWSTDREGVQVMYAYGYTSATIPAEVVRATELIACSSFNRGKLAGMAQVGAGGYSQQLSDKDLPPEAQAVLARYEDAYR